jgi:hypothetical protein
MEEKKESKSITKMIWDGYTGILSSLASWLTPKSSDAAFLKILKRSGQFLVVLVAILLSPLVLVTLIITFFLAL